MWKLWLHCELLIAVFLEDQLRFGIWEKITFPDRQKNNNWIIIFPRIRVLPIMPFFIERCGSDNVINYHLVFLRCRWNMGQSNRRVWWAVCFFMHLLGGLIYMIVHKCCLSQESVPATDLSQLVQWLIRKSVSRPSCSCASIRVLMHLVTEETCLHSKLLIRVSEMLRITNVEDWERVCISLRLTGQERCLRLFVRTNVQCQREGRCV